MRSQPGIVLFRSEYKSVREILTQDQKGNLLDALMDGEYHGDDQLVRMAYNIFDESIRRTEEKYAARCQRNAENIRKRWERKKDAEDTTVYNRIPADTNQYERGEIETKTQRKTKTQKRNIFIPPTVDEVRAYCQERGNTVDPDQFVNYYEARGWELKPGQKMKDWRASVRTWESHQRGWNGELRGGRESDRVRGQRDLYGL